jgi:hypothetical protein
MQYKKSLTSKLTFTYNNFLGDEKIVPNPETGKFNSRFRGYHNFRQIPGMVLGRWSIDQF